MLSRDEAVGLPTISVDLRERIVATYAEGKWTREEVAKRHKVSEGMVKKLLQQHRRTGGLAAFGIGFAGVRQS